MNNLLEKIHSTGFWRVNIKPIFYNKELIPTLSKAKRIMEKCIVLLRGWDYPHFEASEIRLGENWIEMEVDFEGNIEFWRLYQSGQFVHHFACIEDYRFDPKNLSPLSGLLNPSGKYLSILSTLYKMTEIFEFASRIATHQILDSGCNISINLLDMNTRQLFFWDSSRYLRKSYRCEIKEIIYQKKLTHDLLISNSAELAMKATIHIYERFNWLHDSDIIFPEEQKKLLERRL